MKKMSLCHESEPLNLAFTLHGGMYIRYYSQNYQFITLTLYLLILHQQTQIHRHQLEGLPMF
jgi:hypothetical protein